MMEHSLTSILIPVYNRENFVGECIKSALAQTYTNLEVVVVDNASTDRTWEICQQFAEKDRRVRVFRNDTNIGPVRNWLACLAQARGEYGKILFSDDLMSPQFLECTLPYLEDGKVAFVATAATIGESPAGGMVHPAHPGNEKRLSIKRYFKLLIAGEVHYSPGAAVFRMKDIRENLRVSVPAKIPHDFSANGAGPDVMLYALTALSYQQVVLLPQPLVFFRAHPGSFTMLNEENQVANGYRAAIAWFCKSNLSRSFWAKYVARLWWVDAKRTRRWVPMRKHTLSYEGAGKFGEIVAVFMAAIVVVMLDLLRIFLALLKKVRN